MTTRPQRPLVDQVLPKLRPFQREAFEFATKGKRFERQFASSKHHGSAMDPSLLGQGRILLADEMGLGKTLSSLAIMAFYEQEWPLLIICPASLRYTWPAEIEKFFPSIPSKSIYVVAGFQDIGFTKRKDVKIIVVTYSLIQQRSAVANVLNEQHYRCIIADESHNIKQKDAQRTQLLMPVLRKARRLVLLSGTPALARPSELWTQLHCLAPKLIGSWSNYASRYCDPKRKSFGGGRFVMDYTGSSNEAELHGKLKNLMVRRLKSDVLHELPPKQRSILQTSMSVKEKSNCESAMKELKASREPVDQQLVSRSADSKLMAAYQATGIGKASSVAAFVLDWLAGTEKQKILVFAHHKAVLDTIDNAILEKRPNSHIRIDGNVPTAIRAQLVRKFQTCDRVRVALLSMTAAGVGLTLTAASTVLFAELHWTPGVLAQCEDRAHRIGQQHDSVQILYSICKDEKLSLDSTLWNLLGKKIGTLDQVVDGKDDKPYLFNARDEDGLQAGVTSGGGISVQEELTSFFAESSVAESSKAKKKPPAKGSIESYFQKAKSNDKATTSKATNPVEASKSDWRFRLSQPRLATQPFASWKCQHCTLLNPNSVKICKACNREKGGSDDDNVTWNCSKCTLENQRSGSASGLYYCELCSGPYCHGQATEASSASTNATASAASANVSTRTAGASNAQASVGAERKSCLSVDSDSDSDLEELLQIRTFSGKRTARKPKSDKMPAQAHRATETISMVDEPTNSYEASRKEKQVHSEVIVIDDEPITAFTRSQPKRVTMSPEVIDLLGDDDSVDEQPSKRPRKKQGGQPVGTVAFTVSANTGRISVHFDDNELSSFNFSLDDVLDAETSDFLLRAQAKRAPSVNASSLSIKFNLRGIKTVCQNLERSGHHVPRTFEYDVMAFVSEYLKLREIEKKAFANAGRPTRAADFSRVVAALLIQTAKGTDRYIGGAKERARERLEEGTASDVDMAVLDGRACAWCSGRLSSASLSAESTYCSQECAEEGRLRRGGMYSGVQIRSAVFALEQGKCTLCGIDCHALFEQIRSLEPPSRLNKLLSVNWKLPQSAKACDRLLNDPKEGDFWQVDHIRAVALGGGGCGLENLRTLCVPCHLLETERLRGSLRLKSPPRGDSEESSKRKQTQISDFISKKPKAAARNN